MRYYTYFPGCAMESTGIPVQLSVNEICKILDIELRELDDWTCCGCPGAAIDEVGAISFAARNLALAEKAGLDLITACSCCYRNLMNAHLTITEDRRIGAKVSEVLTGIGLEYRGSIRVRSMLDVLVNEVGLEMIASKVQNKLTGLKVACWYGCHQTRPYGPDDFEFPQWMDWVVSSLGAEPVFFPLKSQCCGAVQLISQEDMALKLVWRLLDNATNSGAQCMVTTECPLCFTNLDTNQGRVNSRFKTNFDMPVLSSTQLMGIAFGLTPKAIGLNKNISHWTRVLAPYMKVLV